MTLLSNGHSHVFLRLGEFDDYFITHNILTEEKKKKGILIRILF